ncbi:MAG: hypothetical protein LBE27_03255 [Deltaproteobacteria bacterium]|jgi:hypothetical protein|nr:hypothetical protein [Deltaproteobacteria bacterium]
MNDNDAQNSSQRVDALVQIIKYPVCIVTLLNDLVKDPVLARKSLSSMGIAQADIEKWLEKNEDSPLTFKILAQDDGMAQLVDAWHKKMSFVPIEERDAASVSNFRKIVFIYYDLIPKNIISDLAALDDLERSLDDLEQVENSRLDAMRCAYLTWSWRKNALSKMSPGDEIEFNLKLMEALNTLSGLKLGPMELKGLSKAALILEAAKSARGTVTDLQKTLSTSFDENIKLTDIPYPGTYDKPILNLKALKKNPAEARKALIEDLDARLTMLASEKLERYGLKNVFLELRDQLKEADQVMVENLVEKLATIQDEEVGRKLPVALTLAKYIMDPKPLVYDFFERLPGFSLSFAFELNKGGFDFLKPKIEKIAPALFQEKRTPGAPASAAIPKGTTSSEKDKSGKEKPKPIVFKTPPKPKETESQKKMWKNIPPELIHAREKLRVEVFGLSGSKDFHFMADKDMVPLEQLEGILEAVGYTKYLTEGMTVDDLQQSREFRMMFLTILESSMTFRGVPLTFQMMRDEFDPVFDEFEAGLTDGSSYQGALEFYRQESKGLSEMPMGIETPAWDDEIRDFRIENDEIGPLKIGKNATRKLMKRGGGFDQNLVEIFKHGVLGELSQHRGGDPEAEELSEKLSRIAELATSESLVTIADSVGQHMNQFMKAEELRSDNDDSRNHILAKTTFSFYHSITMGVIRRIVESGNTRLLCAFQKYAGSRLLQTDLSTALHLGVNFSTNIEAVKQELRTIYGSWTSIEQKALAQKPYMRLIILTALARPTVTDPSWELLGFYRVLSKSGLSFLGELADIMEKYLNDTSNFSEKEEFQRECYQYREEEFNYLDKYLESYSRMLNQSKEYETFTAEGNLVWRHLLKEPDGALWALFSQILARPGSKVDWDKLNSQITLLKDQAYFDAVMRDTHRELFGPQALPLSTYSLGTMRLVCQDLIKGGKYVISYQKLHKGSSSSKKPSHYKKYHELLLEWIKKRENLLGDELYFDKFYNLMRARLENVFPNDIFESVPPRPWTIFYPVKLASDIGSIEILFPDFESNKRHRHMVEPVTIFKSTTEYRLLDHCFMGHLHKGDYNTPTVFLEAFDVYKELYPKGEDYTYQEILDMALEEQYKYYQKSFRTKSERNLQVMVSAPLTEEDRLKLGRSNFFYQNYFKDKNPELLKLDPNKYADTLTIAMAMDAQLDYFELTDKRSQSPNYLKAESTFVNILKENPKRLLPVPSRSKPASKRQVKDVLRQFWTKVQGLRDFYPADKELPHLKELFQDLDYNLISKNIPQVIEGALSAIKITNIEIKPIGFHYELPFWRGDKERFVLGTILLSFMGEGLNPSQILEEVYSRVPGQGVKPFMAISFTRLSYEFREELIRKARELSLNFLLLDPNLSDYMLFSEHYKERSEIFRFSGAIYGNVNAYSEQSSGADDQYYSCFQNPLELFGENKPTLVHSSPSYDFTSFIKKRFSEKSNQNNHYIYLSAKEINPLDAIASELEKYGLKADLDQRDLPKGIQMTLAASENKGKLFVFYFDSADEFLLKSHENDFAELLLLKDIMKESPKQLRIFLGGKAALLKSSSLGHILGSVTRASSEYFSQLGKVPGLQLRDYLLNPLKAMGILFKGDFPLPQFLFDLNYEPALVRLFASHLVAKIQAEARRNFSIPPYYVDKELADTLVTKLSLPKLAYKYFTKLFASDPRYKYVIYTVAYLFAQSPINLMGLFPEIAHKEFSSLFPKTATFIDVDELRNLMVELGTGNYFYMSAKPGFHKFNLDCSNLLLPMLGGFREIKREIIHLRETDSIIPPNPRSSLRKPVFKNTKLLPSQHLHFSLDLDDGDLGKLEWDVMDFLDNSKRYEGLPSAFNLKRLAETSEFMGKWLNMVINPTCSKERSIFSLTRFCLQLGIPVIHLRTQNTELEYLDFEEDLFKELIFKLKEEPLLSGKKPLILMDFSDKKSFINGYDCDSFNTLNTFLLRESLPIYKVASIVTCVNFELFFNASLDNQIPAESLPPVLTSNNWTNTSLSIYLQECSLPLELTHKILAETYGVDDLVLAAVAKEKGEPYQLESSIKEPLFTTHHKEVAELLRSMYHNSEFHQIDEEEFQKKVMLLYEQDPEEQDELLGEKVRRLLEYFELIKRDTEYVGFLSSTKLIPIPLMMTGEIFPEPTKK